MANWTFQRIGAVSLVLGVILFVVFIALLPVEPSEVFDDPEETLQEIVDEDALWLSAHVVALLAIPPTSALWTWLRTLVVVGLCALARSIATRPGNEWSRAAFISFLIGTALFFVLVGMDGFGIKGVAEAWADAPAAEKAAAVRDFEAIEAIIMGVAGLTFVALFGVPFVLYGVAISISNDYPWWLGLVAIVIGLGSTVPGMAASFAAAVGESTKDFEGLFIFHALLGIWLLGMAVLLWLKKPALAEPEPSTPA